MEPYGSVQSDEEDFDYSEENKQQQSPEDDTLGKLYNYIQSHKSDIRKVITLWSVFSNTFSALLLSEASTSHRIMLGIIALSFLINAVLFSEGKAQKPHINLQLFQIFSEVLILLVSLYTCIMIPQIGCIRLISDPNLGAINLSLILCCLSFQNLFIGPCIVLFDLFHRAFSVSVMAAILLTIGFYLFILFTSFFIFKFIASIIKCLLSYISRQIKKMLIWKLRKSIYMATNEEGVCPICMKDFQNNEQLLRLSCGHDFHSACVNKWFQVGSLTCPMCRASLAPRWVKLLLSY